jgi:hypothetical protein
MLAAEALVGCPRVASARLRIARNLKTVLIVYSYY